MKNKANVLAALVLIATGSAYSQTITGSVTGTVTDASGAVTPNVKVTITNTGTEVANSTQTNSAGVYNFPFLPVGQYNAAAESTGFKRTVVGPFPLEANQIARLDISLQLGDISQSVEVTDVGPILQTETQ